jgi:hypothetical protein
MEEIINKIGVGKTNKLTLVKKKSKIDLWWEDSDKWFCNILSSKEKESNWIIEKDLVNHLKEYINNDYKIKK